MILAFLQVSPCDIYAGPGTFPSICARRFVGRRTLSPPNGPGSYKPSAHRWCRLYSLGWVCTPRFVPTVRHVGPNAPTLSHPDKPSKRNQVSWHDSVPAAGPGQAPGVPLVLFRPPAATHNPSAPEPTSTELPFPEDRVGYAIRHAEITLTTGFAASSKSKSGGSGTGSSLRKWF